MRPKYLDYANCQILLIGENTEKATEALEKDKKHDKDTPKEALEQLEHEDELRIKHLHGRHFMHSVIQIAETIAGDDSVFDDLKISKKDYPQVPTTW